MPRRNAEDQVANHPWVGGDHRADQAPPAPGGQLNGVQLLGRKTVELMTSDAIRELDLGNYAGDQVLKGYGFGLGVRVRRSTGQNGWMGSVGDYGWAGALGTYFWIDPKEQLIGIVMIQTRNTRLRMEFPNLVYQAISD